MTPLCRLLTVHLLDDEGHDLVRHDFETRLLAMAEGPETGLVRLESYTLP